MVMAQIPSIGNVLMAKLKNVNRLEWVRNRSPSAMYIDKNVRLKNRLYRILNALNVKQDRALTIR